MTSKRCGFALLFALLLGMSAVGRAEMVQEPAAGGSRDLKVPVTLVQHIESDYRAYLKHVGVPNGQTIVRHLLNISIELTQDHRAALQHDTRVVTPLGGGVIDLADIVTPIPGDFWLKLRVRGESNEKISGLHAVFVSHAKERLIDGSMYGAGCDKFMDITSYFNSQMNGHGLQLYTAGRRYLAVLGGTFVIFAFTKDALYVGSVQFEDTRYPGDLCG